jgi:hypothetical protein
MLPLRADFALTAWMMLAGVPVMLIHPPHHVGVAGALIYLTEAVLFAWVQAWGTGGLWNRLSPEPWPEQARVATTRRIRRSAALKLVFLLAVWIAATLISGDGGPLLPIAVGSAIGYAINAHRVAQIEQATNVILYGQRQGWSGGSGRSTTVAAYAREAT